MTQQPKYQPVVMSIFRVHTCVSTQEVQVCFSQPPLQRANLKPPQACVVLRCIRVCGVVTFGPLLQCSRRARPRVHFSDLAKWTLPFPRFGEKVPAEQATSNGVRYVEGGSSAIFDETPAVRRVCQRILASSMRCTGDAGQTRFESIGVWK